MKIADVVNKIKNSVKRDKEEKNKANTNNGISQDELEVTLEVGGFCIRDRQGNILSEVYSSVGDLRFPKCGLLSVRRQGSDKFFFINTKLEPVSREFLLASAFNKNGITFIQDDDGLFYFIDDHFTILTEGFKDVKTFSIEGPYYVQKDDGLFYFVDNTAKIVSRGFDSISILPSHEGFVAQKDGQQFEIDPEFKSEYTRHDAKGIMQLYNNDKISVYRLPEDFFADETLDDIIKKEKESYVYNLNQAGTSEEIDEIKEDAKSKADYIRGMACDLNAKREAERKKAEELERIRKNALDEENTLY